MKRLIFAIGATGLVMLALTVAAETAPATEVLKHATPTEHLSSPHQTTAKPFPRHEAEPTALPVPLRNRVAEFKSIQLRPIQSGELEPAEEDAQLQQRLQAKGELLALLQADLAHADDPRALVELADVHLDMAHALIESPAPSYLTMGQATRYTDALEVKAQSQRDLAFELLERLEDELSDDHPMQHEVNRRLEALQQS